MLKQRYWSVLVGILIVVHSKSLHADFLLDLSMTGPGKVLVITPPDANTYSSNVSLNVTSGFAELVAVTEPIQMTGVPTSITLPLGGDIELDLGTTLASNFVNWSGPAIPSIDPRDPLDPQDATDRTYVISGPDTSIQSVTATFDYDFSRIGIATIEFSFDSQGSWIPATSWNYTGDDGPIPSIHGNTLISLEWGDFVSLIDLNNTNQVDFLVTDAVGNRFSKSFALDVNSASAVPEPSSLMLFALAAGGLLGRNISRVRKRLKLERRP